MLFPLIVIIGLFTATVKTLPTKEHKAWAAKTAQEQEDYIKWQAYLNQKSVSSAHNTFNDVPRQR